MVRINDIIQAVHYCIYSGFVLLANFSFLGQNKHFICLKFGLLPMKWFAHAIPAHIHVKIKTTRDCNMTQDERHCNVLCFVRQTFVFRIPERKKQNLNPTKQTCYTVILLQTFMVHNYIKRPRVHVHVCVHVHQHVG